MAQVAAEKTRVEEERQVAQSVRDFLQNKLLGQADLQTQANALLRAGGFPAEAKQNPTIRELLDRAAHELSPEKIDANFPNQPLVQAEILRTVGNTYRSIGELGKAISYLRRSAALVRQKAAIRHPDTLATIGGQEMADLYLHSGKSDQSLPLGKDTSKLMKVTRGPDNPDMLAIIEDLGNAYQAYGEPNLAIPLLEETLKIKKETLGANHPDTLTSMYNLAAAYQAAGMLDLALPLCEETMMLMRQRCFSPEHQALRNCMRNLALLYQATERPDLVVPLCEETLKLTRARLGHNHPDTLASMSDLAAAYQAVGKLDLAVTLFKETLKGAILYFGPDHPYTLQSMSNLALAYQAAGKLDLAIPLFEDTLKRYLASSSPQPRTLISKSNLASAYQAAGKLDLALPLFEETYRGGKKYPELRSAGTSLLAAYVQAGKTDQAITLTNELLADARTQLPKESPHLAGQLAAIASSLLQAKAFAAAEPLLRECLAIREKVQPDEWTTFGTKSMLGGALLGEKKYAEAEPLLVAGYEGMKRREAMVPPPGKVRLTEAIERLAQLYLATDKKDEAAKWRKELKAWKEAQERLKADKPRPETSPGTPGK